MVTNLQLTNHLDLSTLKKEVGTETPDSTVDRRIPAPPGMHKTLYLMGYTTYQLVQDFSVNSMFGLSSKC